MAESRLQPADVDNFGSWVKMRVGGGGLGWGGVGGAGVRWDRGSSWGGRGRRGQSKRSSLPYQMSAAP